MGLYRKPKTLPLFGFILSIREESIGVKVIEAINETEITIVTVQPNCLNITPVIPSKNVKGKNTAIKTNVEATIERETSLVA